jgi:hypothetical protein
MSDELIDGRAQSIVDSVLAQTGTTVDQTVAQANEIVDQTLAQTNGIVDQTLAQTDRVVDQTLAQSGVDGMLNETRATVDEATGRTDNATAPQTGAAADDRAIAPEEVAPASVAPASNGAADHVRGPAKDAPSSHTRDAVADPTTGSPRHHAEPTSVAPPDLPAGAPQFPDPPVAGAPPADALAAPPKPTADALTPPPSFDAGSFFNGILDSATDPRLLTAAGIALVVGATTIPRAETLADSRLMIQIGMALGFLYAAIVSVWFWATRLRAPAAGRPRRPI